jgi:3-mercaptopyruvate sulfurtransferase SseA
MKAAVHDTHVAILDVRDVDEWIGESSSPYGRDYCPRKGRIPGARWIEWYRMMKPTPAGQRFKSRDEILAECATVGITPETPVSSIASRARALRTRSWRSRKRAFAMFASISVHGMNGRVIPRCR